jgi:hypothetical protein
LGGENVPPKKDKNKLSPLEKRLKAMEYSLWAGRLLDPMNFDKVSKAIKDKNKDAFFTICVKDAGIPQDVSEQLTKGLVDLEWGDGWGGGWG